MEDYSLYTNIVLREDVFDPKFDDEVAPELSDVYRGIAPKIYTDPEEFFSITYFTDSMKNLVKDVSESFKQGKGMTIPLYSFFGGGKTHSLIMLYHAFRNPDIARRYNLDVEGGVKVIVVGGKDSNTAPSPAVNSDVKTLWGYIAKQLGKYDLISNADNDQRAPQKDELEKIFEGEKVLILFDEIVWYLANLKYSLYGNYYRQCLLFFENLASITVNLPLVIVITIPGKYEEKGNRIQAEKGYEDIVEELAKRIERVGKVYRAPIETPVDLGNVLKKRLFKNINDQATLVVKTRYAKYVEQFKDYVDQKSVENLDSTYPFHPYYLDLLKLLLENSNLQSTRDGIRISRMVVRLLWNNKPKRSLILPSNIDIKNEQLKMILLKSYKEFDKVVDSIKEVTKGLSIYFDLANYIFLSTYMYDLGLDPGQYKSALPDSKRIVTSVLDPLYLEEVSLTPAEVKIKLSDMTSESQNIDKIVPYLIASEDRYWFTSFLDPITICRRGKSKIPDSSAIDRLKETIMNLAEIPIDTIDKKSKKEIYSGIIKLYRNIVNNIENLIDLDEEGYSLVILWKPLCDGCDPKNVNTDYYDAIKKFIYNISSGGGRSTSPRKNANSLALMFSLTGNNKDKLMEYTKELLSCENVDIYQYYKDDVSKNIATKMLSDFILGVKNSIYNLIFSYYDKLAYPADTNDVKVVDLAINEKTLLGNAEHTLRNEGKIISENNLDFDTLAYYLEQISINLREARIPYPQLRSMFYTNPMLPWVTEETLKNAIVSGVNSYSIGILTGSSIYFKRLEGKLEYDASIINNSTTILPAKTAAEIQIENLIKEEKEIEEGDIIRKIYYIIETEEGEIPLREIRNRENWFDIFKAGNLKRKEEVIESGINIEVEPKEIEAKSGETVSVKVKISKIGKFNGEVSLEANKGNLSVNRGIPPFETSLTLRIDNDESIRLIGKYDNKQRDAIIPVKIMQERMECERIVDLDNFSNPVISRVSINDFKDIMNTLNQLRLIPGVKIVEGEIFIEDPSRVSVTVKPKGMKLNEFTEFLNRQISLVGMINSAVSGRIIIKVNEAKVIDEKDKKKIADLISKKVITAWVKVC